MPLKKSVVAKKKKQAMKQREKQSVIDKAKYVAEKERKEAEVEIPIEDCRLARGFNYYNPKSIEEGKQTFPPSKAISEVFPENNFPEGEFIDYSVKSEERKTEEAKKREEEYEDKLRDLREGSEIHRQVRNFIQRVVRPGMKMIKICELIENKNRELIGIDHDDRLKRGIGFPTGVSLNNVAAHYTPNPNEDLVLKKEDIMKVDFGTQINGRIIDCAFTATFDAKYDNFINVVKEATNTGIREIGIDVRMADIGAAISEVMMCEVEIGDKLYNMRPIANLNGHNIDDWIIHNGKTVPLTDNGDNTKMEEGELYAVETFGSTGNGIVKDSSKFNCSHYMKNPNAPFVYLEKSEREFLNYINKNYNTLAFCRRWLHDEYPGYNLSLHRLVQNGIIEEHPALEDKSGSYTAQYEHTIFLRPTCKEVVSRGEDF